MPPIDSPSSNSSQPESPVESREGVRIGTESREGVRIETESREGVRIWTESREGVRIGTESRDGVRIGTESREGVRIGTESREGVRIGTESRDGVRIGTESRDGVRIGTESREDRGIKVESQEGMESVGTGSSVGVGRSVQYHLLTSAVAAGVAELGTLPIATIKTNYQNTEGVSIWNVGRSIYARQGMRGFYNSSGWAMASQILSTSAKYTWYQILNEYIPNKFVAGGLAGVMTSVMIHPIDVIKIHQQMHTPFLPQLQAIGPTLFYRGYTKTLSKYVIGSIFYFPLYDIFTQYMDSNLAAIGSATMSTIIIQPIDYMKIRQIYGQPFFQGWNPLPYFKGLSLNLARSVPHFTITMGIIHALNRAQANTSQPQNRVIDAT